MRFFCSLLVVSSLFIATACSKNEKPPTPENETESTVRQIEFSQDSLLKRLQAYESDYNSGNFKSIMLYEPAAYSKSFARNYLQTIDQFRDFRISQMKKMKSQTSEFSLNVDFDGAYPIRSTPMGRKYTYIPAEVRIVPSTRPDCYVGSEFKILALSGEDDWYLISLSGDVEEKALRETYKSFRNTSISNHKNVDTCAT